MANAMIERDVKVLLSVVKAQTTESALLELEADEQALSIVERTLIDAVHAHIEQQSALDVSTRGLIRRLPLTCGFTDWWRLCVSSMRASSASGFTVLLPPLQVCLLFCFLDFQYVCVLKISVSTVTAAAVTSLGAAASESESDGHGHG
jgi:hypothetical protein